MPLWTLVILGEAEYHETVKKLRAQVYALSLDSVEVTDELEQRCGESKRLLALSKSLRRDVVMERVKAGEMRVKALHRRLREASGRTAWHG